MTGNITGSSTKKTWSKPISKNKPQFKRDLLEFDVTGKKGFKKYMLRLREIGSFKTKLPKKAVKMSEKWIEIIEEPETVTKIYYDLSPRQGRFAVERLPKHPGQLFRLNVGTSDTLGTFRRV